eukprot:13723294-Ditylum_brightwellii.AAC.1
MSTIVPNDISAKDKQQQRAASAFLGAITADAATQTSHWSYNRTAFHEELKQAERFETPEFYKHNKFYDVDIGYQSCYGDQLLEIARHIATSVNDESSSSDDCLISRKGQTQLINRFELAFGSKSVYGPHPSPAISADAMPIKGPW